MSQNATTSLPSKVVLIGQMGAGKSTVAKQLARLWPTHRARDLDAMIVAKGRSIEAIFAESGEATFRAIEAATLTDVLADARPIIIATGGGAPCQPGAIERMRERALVVWLMVAPAVLARRVAHTTTQRPLLTNLSGLALDAFLIEQLEARRPFYAQAHLTVDGSGPPDVVASSIDLAVRALVDQTS